MVSPESLEREMQLRMALKQALDGLESTIEAFKMFARLQRAYYQALCAEGFSVQEALYLTAAWHPLRANHQPEGGSARE